MPFTREIAPLSKLSCVKAKRYAIVFTRTTNPLACDRATRVHYRAVSVYANARRVDTTSALAMILAAGMTVGDGPGKVSGDLKDETARLGAAIWSRFGLELRPVGEKAVCEVIDYLKGGLEVTAVKPDSPTDKAGIRRGDILIGAGWCGTWDLYEMLSVDHVAWVRNQCEQRPGLPLWFFLIREKRPFRKRIILD
jgi:hypothetical protein